MARHAWIPAIGAELHVGIDGLSLLLVLLTSLVFPFALLAQRTGRGFCALMLVMQAALYGTFTAQNFVLWFLFYEMSLIPGFLLIKIWGGEIVTAPRPSFSSTPSSAASRCCSLFSTFTSLGEHSISPSWRRSERAGFLPENGLARLRGHLPRARGQGAAFSFSHLASRRLRNRADRRLDGPDRRAFEDGRLRFHPAPPAAFP